MNLTAPGRVTAYVSTLMATLVAAAAFAAPAQGAAYRYWSYWLGESGTWVAAQTGAGDHTLVDQDVQGWRFGITTDAPAQTPDNDPTFADLCPELAQSGPSEGQVRVAVVIDSGFIAEAPEGQTPPEDTVTCTTLPEGATGNQALAAAGTITDSNGIVCAVNGYPADECAPEVPEAQVQAAAEAAATEQPNPATISAGDTDDSVGQVAETGSEESTNTGLLVLVGVVLLGAVGGAALLVGRRRGADTEQ